jgi:hypothetical protein
MNNGKNGYGCMKCAVKGIVDRCTPLYRRINDRFEFSGWVECPAHGVVGGVSLRELMNPDHKATVLKSMTIPNQKPKHKRNL